ncbi:uncharacterized protein LOC102807862 [Saccoglossus kowalevskii]|uniref:Uncharacterized G-patch domain protein DDB_G0278987-like n=1 Tax=Saccoglossus kowalevskii TaxID=10224 RepID=A0ABM0M1W6_SACKO|nr:PREDICTED: uncharacterized G-patch domain protein DDB_G0278987-like [Saccoglossus kowalevskii]
MSIHYFVKLATIVCSSSEMSTKKFKRVKQTDLIDSSGDKANLSKNSCAEKRIFQKHENERKEETPSVDVRFSRRLKERAERKLHIPSRDEILKSLVPQGTPSKGYNHLRPRKLINNFFKVHNQYNYDPDYSSDGDDKDDFIQYTDEESSSESTDADSSKSADSESECANAKILSTCNRGRHGCGNSRDRQKIKSRNKRKKSYAESSQRKQATILSSDEECTSDEVGRSKAIQKNKVGQKRKKSFDCSPSSDESNEKVFVRKRKSSTSRTSALVSSDEEKEVFTVRRKSHRVRNSDWQNKLAAYKAQRQLKTANKQHVSTDNS